MLLAVSRCLIPHDDAVAPFVLSNTSPPSPTALETSDCEANPLHGWPLPITLDRRQAAGGTIVAIIDDRRRDLMLVTTSSVKVVLTHMVVTITLLLR